MKINWQKEGHTIILNDVSIILDVFLFDHFGFVLDEKVFNWFRVQCA